MATWHVWGDYGITKPECIGSAKIVSDSDKAARKTAEAKGFDFDYRLHNGFSPWAAAYEASGDGPDDFDFASNPVVKGWQQV